MLWVMLRCVLSPSAQAPTNFVHKNSESARLVWNRGQSPGVLEAPVCFKHCSIPVISSRAGGRKFQKEKETIGRSDVWLFFCTTPARASLERHFSEWTNSTNQAGISTSHYFFLEMYSSQHFSLGISTSEYFSLEISSEEETHPKLTLFS